MSQFAAPASTAAPVTRDTVIEVGRTYRGKHPRLTSRGYVNDREVIFVGQSTVEFASPSIPDGAACPSVTLAEFRDWAGHDVTALYEGREDWHDANDLQAWRDRALQPIGQAA